MIKVWESSQLFEIETLKHRLEQAGIACVVKNQYASGLAGEVPFAEVFPELWIVDPQDHDRAKALLDHWRSGQESIGPVWTCGRCGEEHGPQFSECWNCGAKRT